MAFLLSVKLNFCSENKGNGLPKACYTLQIKLVSSLALAEVNGKSIDFTGSNTMHFSGVWEENVAQQYA